MWEQMKDQTKKFDLDMIRGEFSTRSLPSIPIFQESQPKEVQTLLDAKREKTVSLVIGTIRLSADEIHRALLFTDFSVLTKDLILKLNSIAPDPEEQAKFTDYTQGDIAKLSKASQFCYALSDIPNIKNRIACFKVILTFDEEIERLTSSLQIFIDMIKMVRHNKGLFTLIEVILSLGNYMNGGTKLSGAWGFHITLLQKLQDIKTTDNKKTLLT